MIWADRPAFREKDRMTIAAPADRTRPATENSSPDLSFNIKYLMEGEGWSS